jgi:putative nucleotidyltransferase with HDIG domain
MTAMSQLHPTFDAIDHEARFAAIRTAADDLPTPPEILSELLLLVSRSAPWAEIDRVLRTDPALSGKVISLANSAALRGRRAVRSIDEACARIGERALLRLVIASAVDFVDVDVVPWYDIADRGLWRHSVTCALAADLLASNGGAVPRDVAYAAGLLADCGKLILGMIGGESPNPRDGESFDDVERERFGVDHATVSAWLLRRWGLDNEIVNAVLTHHRPAPDDELARILHVADAAALSVGGGGGRDAFKYQFDDNALPWSREETHRVDRLVLDVAVALTQNGHLLNGD